MGRVRCAQQEATPPAVVACPNPEAPIAAVNGTSARHVGLPVRTRRADGGGDEHWHRMHPTIAEKVPSRRHFFSISKSEVPNTQEQLFVVWPHPTPQHDSHRVFFFHTGGPYFLHLTATANPHTPKTIMRRSALSRATSVLLALLSTATGRQLYPVKAALQTGRLPVSDTHTLYYEVHGKADGAPALFLHGGPGAGCFQRHAGFFDPEHYRIVLFDQRGCGRSTPKGSLEDNDTPSLVADCEALRQHLDVEQWQVVLGGSWGVCLALSLALAHPRRVGSLVLRAVCLMRSTEILWLFGGTGVARLQPKGFEAFSKAAQPPQQMAQQAGGAGCGEEEALAAEDDAILRWYAAALRGDLGDEAMGTAAAAWGRWEMSVYGLSSRMTPPPLPVSKEVATQRTERGALPTCGRLPWVWQPRAHRWVCRSSCPEIELDGPAVERVLLDEFAERVAKCCGVDVRPDEPPRLPRRPSQATKVVAGAAADAPAGMAAGAAVHAAGAATAVTAAPPAAGGAAGGTPKGYVPAQARLTSHYSERRAFLGGDESIISRIAEVRHIPCVAVQGGNDLICPPSTAIELHRAWPEMELVVVPGAGHSMYDAGLMDGVLDATDRFRASK